MSVTHVLITNLQYATVNDVRVSLCALTLVERPRLFNDEPAGYDRRAVGFGVDCAWFVFDMGLPSIVYTLEDDKLQIDGGPLFDLARENWEQPLDVQTFSFAEDVGNRSVHVAVAERAAHYWRAPFMPTLRYGPVDQIGPINIARAHRP
ncbi:hypothetical protein LCGC14_1533130 [marine sediment metagenome]|uniref:Uncharacterized protein n=1 Tax=marine sediment metagenome TaxID=412755 RepID=A0A0F9IVG0_9ZZZZ